jgi:hypothetical protein
MLGVDTDNLDVALAGDRTLRGKPTSMPRLSAVELNGLATDNGPTWLDKAIIGKFQVQSETTGFAAKLRQVLGDRGRCLAGCGLATISKLERGGRPGRK